MSIEHRWRAYDFNSGRTLSGTAIVATGAFGCAGWRIGLGIRGQYGHETGAMIAGVLLSLVLVFLFCPRSNSLSAARAVALATVAIGFGGSMTYAQTIGLTQDPPLVGNWAAWRWGMLGLALKGSLWIGFGGLFLGIGLSGIRYRPLELLGLMALVLLLFFLGKQILNEPFDPAHRVLPRWYFSDDWRWEPGELKPRRELWGGLLLGLTGASLFARVFKKDSLALALAGWGCLGGALGFPLGQCLQSFHAWNRELFHTGFWLRLEPVLNWWNMMETTFGAVMGATLGLGLWLNRRRIATLTDPTPAVLAPAAEIPLLIVYVTLLLLGEFARVPILGPVADLGLAMGVVPLVCIAAGRLWPFFLALPVTLLPIAGKTIRRLVYEEKAVSVWSGWIFYCVLPLIAATAMAWYFARPAAAAGQARNYLRSSLLLCAWLYFILNFAFFRWPWPWLEWTYRTPNGIIYAICATGLTLAALRIHNERGLSASQESAKQNVEQSGGTIPSQQ